MQLARSELEDQVARRGFERAQRVQWRQQIGHDTAIMPASSRRFATDYL